MAGKVAGLAYRSKIVLLVVADVVLQIILLRDVLVETMQEASQYCRAPLYKREPA